MTARPRSLAVAVAVIAVLLVAARVLPAYQVTLLVNIGLAAIATLGLVLLTGIAGMTSFGQAAFVGLGAYTTAWLGTAPGVPAALASPLVGLAAGLVLTLAVATVLGAVTLRLSGHFLPLATIAWGLALYFVFGTTQALGGRTGLSNLPPLRLFGLGLERPGALLVVVWGLLAVLMLGLRNVLDSRSGRALRALAGGQAMAASMGVDVGRTKLVAFLVSAALGCIAGWLYAQVQRFVSPEPFGLSAGIDYLFMALIGGTGHLGGAVVGAAVFTVAKDVLQDALPKLLGATGNVESIVFGLLVIGLMQKAPGGIAGWIAARLPKRPALAAVTAAPLSRRPVPRAGTPVLEARGLTRRFGGLVANRDVDLTLRAGEILAVIGPNGAGKSTLFDQLSCCDRPTAGSVRVLGVDAAGWTADDAAAAGLARTFQHVRLLRGMSVLDNVALGAHRRGSAGLLRSALRLDRAEEARLRGEAARQLERVGLGDRLHDVAGRLPLGQQRLVEIARALCADPSVLLLDEPAAGLRPLEKQALATLLRRLRDDGMAVLLVEHDMDVVMRIADRVTVMVFGETIASGIPAEVRRDPAVVAAYLGVAA